MMSEVQPMLLERVTALLAFQGLGSRSVQLACPALGQSFYVYISLYIQNIPMGYIQRL